LKIRVITNKEARLQKGVQRKKKAPLSEIKRIYCISEDGTGTISAAKKRQLKKSYESKINETTSYYSGNLKQTAKNW
jgi:hypothetical protein